MDISVTLGFVCLVGFQTFVLLTSVISGGWKKILPVYSKRSGTCILFTDFSRRLC